MTDIIVALIALIGTLGGSLGGILVSSKMTNYRLQQLEGRVAEHEQFRKTYAGSRRTGKDGQSQNRGY